LVTASQIELAMKGASKGRAMYLKGKTKPYNLEYEEKLSHLIHSQQEPIYI
jgi:hypothetical protein